MANLVLKNNTAGGQTSVTADKFIGNADTATKLKTARKINDVLFDGTTNITIQDSTKLPLTGGTMTGPIIYKTGPAIIRVLRDDSNYGEIITWQNTTTETEKYKAQIGRHNTGGNSSYPGTITILPYATDISPWSKNVGLNISKDNMLFEGHIVLHSNNYNLYALPLSGGILTGPLAFNTNTYTGNIIGRNANGQNRYEFYSASNTGGIAPAILRIYNNTEGTSYVTYKFGADGILTATTFAGSLSGNATSASKLATARTISLTGSVTGSGTFDGSENLTISTTVNSSHYCVCETTVDVPAKAVACAGFQLGTGAAITIKFTKGLVLGYGGATTLNVNNTGAKPVLYRGIASNKSLPKNGIYNFVYDGTSFHFIGDLDQVNNGITMSHSAASGNYPLLIGDKSKLPAAGEQVKSVQALYNSATPIMADLSSGSIIVPGDIKIPITKAALAPSVPVSSSDMAISSLTQLSNYKTYFGGVYMNNNTWYNLISIRHRNGESDGTEYGLYMRSVLTTTGDLTWGKQYGTSYWQAERTILDSNNYSRYALPLSGGTLSIDNATTINWLLTLFNTGNANSTGWGTGIKFRNASDRDSKFAAIACYASSVWANGNALRFYTDGGSCTFEMEGNRFYTDGIVLKSSQSYGSSFPSYPSTGQLFFKV